MREALKACPHCGAQDEYNPSVSRLQKYAEPGDRETGKIANLAAGLVDAGWYVECDVCGASGGHGDDRDLAIAAWNRRAPLPASEAGEVRLWVKLTDNGRAYHRRRHTERYPMLAYHAPDESNDGWSKWQLWALMQDFGEGMHLGGRVPFETTIRIPTPTTPREPMERADEAREVTCGASPDHADILETIKSAADGWQKQGYTSALAEVRDMANVGRALMEALPEGYSYMNCPSEIVSDLQNERDDALASMRGGEVERLRGAREYLEGLATCARIDARVARKAAEREAGTPYAVEQLREATRHDADEKRHLAVALSLRADAATDEGVK